VCGVICHDYGSEILKGKSCKVTVARTVDVFRTVDVQRRNENRTPVRGGRSSSTTDFKSILTDPTEGKKRLESRLVLSGSLRLLFAGCKM
jgi:hypothetical protein